MHQLDPCATRCARFLDCVLRLGALALLLGTPTRIARAQSVATSSNDRAVIVRADSLSWTDLGLIPGVKIAVLNGNPQDTGTYLGAAARMAHYGRARDERVIQLSGPGPYEVVFVNPADDPRKRAPAKP